MQASPFLITANKPLGYRTVVAPTNLNSRIAKLLADVAGKDISQDGTANARIIRGGVHGDFTLIYRRIRAKSSLITPNTTGYLKDSFGRDIFLIEGIIVDGVRDNITVLQKEFEQAHKIVAEHFKDFWTWEKDKPYIKDSSSIIIGKTKGSPLSISYEDDYVVRISKTVKQAIEKIEKQKSTIFKEIGMNKPVCTFIAGISLLGAGYAAYRTFNSKHDKNNHSWKETVSSTEHSRTSSPTTSC